uniref:Complement factor H-related protein 1-like n=1 Tax=Nothoprocta perdicaria TaxID=30464 RepID=A0A8C6YYZ5_NOTPE
SVATNEDVCTASAGAACGEPPVIDFGEVASGNKAEYEENDSVQYTCNPGYTLSGSEWVTCRRPQWLQIRKSEKCGPPPVIESGDLLSFPQQEYASGATVEYKCPSLYVLKGSPTITCVGGQWTTPPVCLVACTASEEDMDRNNIELRETTKKKLYLKSGDFAEFKCKVGYKQDPASSPFRVQCVEGTLVYPHCKPGSKSPEVGHCFSVVLLHFAACLNSLLFHSSLSPPWQLWQGLLLPSLASPGLHGLLSKEVYACLALQFA